MDKINAPIKQRILQYIDYKSITKESFLKKSLISSSNFKSNGLKSEIGGDKLAYILSVYDDLNPEWLLTGKGSMLKEEKLNIIHPKDETFEEYLPLIPIEAMAGYASGVITVHEHDVKDRYVIPEFTQKGAKYIIRVSGSSMYPKYSNGDLLGCKPISDTSFFQWGKPYVLDTDQGPLVKRLYPVDGESEVYECRSDNNVMYPPFKIHRSSIYRIAIVVGVIRQE